jgi:hypothetical protein
MPKKILKMFSGRVVEIYAVRLPSGSVVVPSRMPQDRNVGYWKLVKPDSKEAKWWSGVTIDGSDPRDDPDYKARLAAIKSTPEYRK